MGFTFYDFYFKLCIYHTNNQIKKLRRSRFFSFSLLLIPIIYTVADAIIVIYQSSALI